MVSEQGLICLTRLTTDVAPTRWNDMSPLMTISDLSGENIKKDLAVYNVVLEDKSYTSKTAKWSFSDLVHGASLWIRYI